MKKLFKKAERREELRTPFKYKPLEGTEIRLLRLQSSYGYGPAKSLSANLVTIPLQDDSSSVSTPYEALSYCWGTEAADHTLSLDDTSFAIKPNLESALRELSKGMVERFLWVDAICINQADLNERNEQVRMMSSIYRRAARVVIWIGPGPPSPYKNVATEAIQTFARRQRTGADSQQLSTFLDNPLNKFVTKTHWDGSTLKEYTEVKAVDHSAGHWPFLVDFFDRPWWRRVWVRQEVAVSRQAIVQCGEKTVDWRDVAAISHWLKVCGVDVEEKSKTSRVSFKVPTKNNQSGPYSGEDLEYFRQTKAIKGEIDFETMLIHARDCESTNPRDKVYSILGLTGNATKDIIVDYSMPVSVVAVQAFRKQTNLSKSLDALIWSQNPCREESIPSWAPNLCSPFSAQPTRLKGKASSLYAASGLVRRKEQYAFHEDGITLSVQGASIFDGIKHVSETPFRSRHLSPAELDHIISVWKPLVFNWLGTMEFEQKYERFMSALTCDRDIRNRRLPKRADGLDWGTYFRVMHLSVGARTEFEYLALAARRTAFEGGASGQTELNAWLKLCAESIGGRRIIMTTNGRIGLVPAETQPGDVVCLLGLDVPFILRKIEADIYIVIGEAYIHGAMDGEMLSTHGVSDASQFQNILLQ